MNKLFKAGVTSFGHIPFVVCKLGIVVFSSAVFNPIVERINDRSAVVSTEASTIVCLGIIAGGFIKGISSVMKEIFEIITNEKIAANTYKTVLRDYQKREDWARKSLMNTACSGTFASDNSIKKYAEEIWHAKPVNKSNG